MKPSWNTKQVFEISNFLGLTTDTWHVTVPSPREAFAPKNQGYISVIWSWEKTENPDPPLPRKKCRLFWNVNYFDFDGSPYKDDYSQSFRVMKDIIKKQRWLQILLAPSVNMVSGHFYDFFL